MIVSYETLRTLSVHLANCTIGLLLCDEGHRLKNSGMEPSAFCVVHTHATLRVPDLPGTEWTQRETQGHPLRHSHPGKSNRTLIIINFT